MASVAVQCLNSLAHTELELANRLSVYGDVKEDAMRDGHVWCIIGSARKREQAGDEGGPHAVHRKRKFGKFSQIEQPTAVKQVRTTFWGFACTDRQCARLA